MILKTMGEAVEKDETEKIRNEWITHVLEHGEVLNREDGMFSQHCSVDVGIVVCKKEKGKNLIFAAGQDIPRIVSI